MAYWAWGDPGAPHLVVCVHGLARQGRDFDTVARALVDAASGALRVACPDLPGRGRSDWLQDPAQYQIPAYVPHMLVLLQHLGQEAHVETLDWVGTSMGGLLGLALAATPGLPLPAPLRRLVLNDVGPVVQWQALQRIAGYLGRFGSYATVEEGAQALRAISQTFGPHSEAEWMALSRPMLRALPEGGWTFHYDPAIALPVRALTPEAAAQAEAAVWDLYDRCGAEVLLLRGAESDLLSHETAQAMTQRGPRARLVEFEGVGHAPTLVAAGQVATVSGFLLA